MMVRSKLEKPIDYHGSHNIGMPHITLIIKKQGRRDRKSLEEKLRRF